MNTENLNRLIATLESIDDHRFTMADYIILPPDLKNAVAEDEGMAPDEVTSEDVSPQIIKGNCGTAACIAGWAATLDAIDQGQSYYTGSVDRMAAEWLELAGGRDGQLAYALFRPAGFGDNVDENERRYTRLRAIAVLKHLRDHGAVRWFYYDEQGVYCGP